jgi:hypothetical protein
MQDVAEASRSDSRPVPSPSLPVTGEPPTAPEQIWRLLTPTQQQKAFLVLVQVCHQLVTSGHAEVLDE